MEPVEHVELGEMTLAKFNMFSIEALKSFLVLRSKPIEGSFDELAARAFITWEEKIQVNPDKEHSLRQAMSVYKEKLVVQYEDKPMVLPDPLTLKDGWLDEGQAITKWPSTYFEDVSEFLRMSTPQELRHRLVNEYKQGKAYRYFVSGWVQEVMWHPIQPNHPLCFLWARVCPSMSVRKEFYQVWVAVEKDRGDVPGGKIYSAYCTCTAGLLGICNHVAGVLFRVEAAARTGANNLSCTSRGCQWNLPQHKDLLHNIQKISDVDVTKGHYLNQDKLQAPELKVKKALFTPMSVKQASELADPHAVRQRLATALRPHAGDSCFLGLIDRKRKPKEVEDHTPVHMPVPLSLPEKAANLSPNDLDELEQPLSPDETMRIEEVTRGQATSSEWVNQRRGRITATKMKAVSTKLISVEQKGATADSMVQTIMGYKKVPSTAAMKHGRTQEPHARRLYRKIQIKHHRHFSTQDSGLVVMQEYPFIGASPDVVVTCDCCGKGLCEIKCPYATRDKKPSNHLPYLSGSHLKTNHEYYYQVQGQMGVAGLKYCDFFVYTSHGHHLERIIFDEAFWLDLLPKLRHFWSRFIAPELLSRSLWEQDQQQPSCSAGDHSYSSEPAAPLPARKAKATYHPKSTDLAPAQFLCGACKEEVECSAVECSQCSVWWHFGCVGIPDGEAPQDEDLWFCPQCIP